MSKNKKSDAAQRKAVCDDWNNDFVGQWIKYADEHKQDFMFRFIGYWVAFVHVLDKKIGSGDERYRITKFCERYDHILKDYQPFIEPGLMEEILKQEIPDNEGNLREEEYNIMRDHDKESDECIDNEGISSKRRLALFQTLYTIRCNLVHGEKSISSDRDRRLLEESADIMEEYMRVIHKNIPLI